MNAIILAKKKNKMKAIMELKYEVGFLLTEKYEATHVVMNDFALISDHTVLLQGRDKSKIDPVVFSTKSRPIQGGGIRNNIGYNDSRTISESCGKRNGYPQTHKKDITAPMSAEGSLFSAEEYIGISNVISSSEGNTMRTQDEHKNKGKDLLYCDWPDLGSLEDFETNLRLDDAKEFLPRVASLSSRESRSLPSSSGEIEHFSQNSDVDLFCPFANVTSTTRVGSYEGLEVIVCSNQELLVPTSSSIMCNDEVVSSSTCSGPDFVAAYVPHSMKKSHDPFNGTPDMILDGMAENPLEKYFPPLTTYEQPELLLNDNSAQVHQFPEDFAGDDVLNSVGLQFCSKGRTSAELCENPCSPLIPEAVPVKDLGFQKLQEGMNQLDVATKTGIRDALYRLANCVEQRHCFTSTTNSVDQLTSGAVESSDAKRFKSNRWTEIQTNPMDRSVAQLLLQKPLYRKTGLPHPPGQANHVT